MKIRVRWSNKPHPEAPAELVAAPLATPVAAPLAAPPAAKRAAPPHDAPPADAPLAGGVVKRDDFPAVLAAVASADGGRPVTPLAGFTSPGVPRRSRDEEPDTDPTFSGRTPVDPAARPGIIGGPNMMEAIGFSDPGCVRPNNEDYFAVDRDRGLYVVADGMGGAQAGEHASRLAVETVVETIGSTPQASAERLAFAFEEANRRVMAAAAADPLLDGMGTTLVAALECGPELLIASVGDSRAYVYDGDGLAAITEDQTWVHEVGRRLGIDEESLRTHPMRHVLTMAIGVSPQLRVHSYALQPRPGAHVLLSSDGLHGVVPEEAIGAILAGAGGLEEKCRRLIGAAREAGGPDNITVVLLEARDLIR